ncbi:MAG: aldo/keto reductase [Planctomycetales bacterium]|nr:aldo/keto reductase [Planctomycetales bacterium]
MNSKEDSSPGRRSLGDSDLIVSPVSLGTWPMAGVTSLDVNDADSIATLRACAELGINFIDTAYCYGLRGESENLIRRALADSREQYVLATKCGIHYNAKGEQTQDARPATILSECDESLRRLGSDRVELYYLHSPDPNVPVAESAGAIGDLIAAGKVRYAGASNCSLEQIKEFHAVCPLTAVQLPYNMLQRDIEKQTIPWCQENGVAGIVYWALMKGLLAGRLTRQEQLAENDNRRNYPMYQGEEWNKNQAFIGKLREIADECNNTVAQVVVNWTIQQPGITVALCGARRLWQLEETAAAMGWQLTGDQLERISAAIAVRGHAAAKRVFT